MKYPSLSNRVEQGQKSFLVRCVEAEVSFTSSALTRGERKDAGRFLKIATAFAGGQHTGKRSHPNPHLKSRSLCFSLLLPPPGAVHYALRGPGPDLGPPSADAVPLGRLLFLCSQNRPDDSGGMTVQARLQQNSSSPNVLLEIGFTP